MTTSATELWGREGELEALTSALDDARNRTGRVALLEGEAGIGKTRLVDELCTRAEALGVQVFRGSAEELEQGRPFGALLDALGAPDGVPGLSGGGRSGASDARFLAQDAFVDRVERLSADGPVMLAVDDAHWADRASLSTLWALARRSADLGLMLVLAYRPTPQPPELARTIQGCRDLGALHLRLGPIADDAVAQLAADVVGGPVGSRLLSELQGARGNPFVTIELLRAREIDRDSESDVEPQLPAALRASLLRRLTALGEEAQRALSVAAVLGNIGRIDDLAAMLDVPLGAAGDAIAEAARAGLLEPEGELLAFRHDLIREALYQDIPEAVRAGWHRTAARQLEGHAEPAVLARHLVLGATRDDVDVIDRLQRTAEAIARTDPDAASDLLERAIALTSDQAACADLAVARADALLAAGRAEDAGNQADDVLSNPDASPIATARAHLARGEASSHQGRTAIAVDAFAAARATGALDEATAAYALGRQAENRIWTFALPAALAEADEALAEGRRLGIAAVTVEALAARCAVHEFRAELGEAIAAGREAVSHAATDPESLRRTPHAYLGLALLAADQMGEARTVAEEGRRRSTALGQVLVLPNYQVLLSRIAWFAGRWDDAIAEIDTAASLAEDFGLRFGENANEGVRGLIAFHRGDHATARATLERRTGIARGGDDDASGSELLVLLRAQLLEADGDATAATAELLALFEGERALGMDAARLWPGPACVRFALAAGNDAAARDVATDLAEVASKAGTASARGAAALARGLVDRDPESLTEAAAAFGAAHRELDRLVALEAAASAFGDAGRRDDAVACLKEAATIAEQLGASHDGRRISASLRELGVRAGTREKRRQATHGWDALTDAERQVAQLVDAGLRNGEIAERLFVSRRTVESHMSRLYAKLEVENRVALARKIREHAERGAA